MNAALIDRTERESIRLRVIGNEKAINFENDDI